MKKRAISLLLVLVLALSAVTLPAMALGSFSDVSDKATAQNAEVLRLLGVVDGTGGGSFNPGGQLTRAEFCKMTVELIGLGKDQQSYRTMTIFSDVRASHWASGYINLAVRQSDPKLLAGMPDGTFQPDRAITYGEAVTILMRVLGYNDADSGRIWPSGYINLANAKGVGTGLSLSGGAAISRAQAAQLFVNVLNAEKKDGTTYVPANCTREEKETTLVSLSGGTMRVSGSAQNKYDLVRPSSATVLNGLKGHLLTNKDGKAVTFVPSTNGSTGVAVSDAAVIVDADRSTAGISALTGGKTDYAVYRNGMRTSVSALRKNDVVTYDAASNTIYVCDTRVTAYYEACDPSPSAPDSIELLGGTSFPVVATAQESLAQYRPGKVLTFLLTADGSIAGAVENDSSLRGNALGVVSGSGKVQMICGSTMIDLNAAADSSYYGKLVSIASTASGKLTLSTQSNSVSGNLNISEKTLGGKKLADNVMIYDDGELISLSDLDGSVVPQSAIAYARTNANGQIDLIVLSSTSSEKYGRVTVNTKDSEWIWYPGHGEDEKQREGINGYYTKLTVIEVDCNDGATYSYESGNAVKTGDFVMFKENKTKTNFSQMVVLDKITGVSKSSWIGTGAVSFGGKTYTVPSNVLCWNADSESWFDELEDALAYGGKMNLYVKDGIVRAVELGG